MIKERKVETAIHIGPPDSKRVQLISHAEAQLDYPSAQLGGGRENQLRYCLSLLSSSPYRPFASSSFILPVLPNSSVPRSMS